VWKAYKFFTGDIIAATRHDHSRSSHLRDDFAAVFQSAVVSLLYDAVHLSFHGLHRMPMTASLE